ncbi:uncharacterized protein [Centruroides vittatus]|uniref:uncharacterized protein n=1 Tax=Centruroides vittatus TaxID=120091 RepID=UPI00350EB949
MALKMLYLLPMILGRTFDAINDRVGIDIFPESELKKVQVNDHSFFETTYKMIQNSQEVKQVLQVSGDFSLKVKSGKVDLKGFGNYLRSSTTSEKTVEILTRTKYYTHTESLPFHLKPRSDWASHRPEDLGTHYVQSITYGGELISSLRFIAHKVEDVRSIRAKISAEVQGMKLEQLIASGKLGQLKNDLRDKANMEISYFATVPLKDVPNTIEGLQKLVEGFDEQVKSVNNGAGVPVRVELMELATFDPRFQFLINKALENALKAFEDQFDDLRVTKDKLTDWIRSLPPTLTQKQEHEITRLYERIRNVLRVFQHTIGVMDIEKGTDQLSKALQAYKEGGKGLPGKFKREFDKLRFELVRIHFLYAFISFKLF